MCEEMKSPKLLAEKVCSAAIMLGYVIYVTEQGTVKLIGNGEYADRFEGFENAQRVFVWDGVFWIQDIHDRWFAFGDNGKEQIEKRTEQCIYEIVNEPFKCQLREYNFSAGPPSNEVYKGRMRDGFDCEFTTDDVSNRLKKINLKYGDKNVSVEDLNYRITQSKYEGYFYDAEGVCFGRVILRNNYIYKPVESVFENLENCKAMAMNEESVVLIENFKDYQFGLKRTGEFCVKKIKDGEVAELVNWSPVLTGVKDFKTFDPSFVSRYIIFSMQDGRALYGNLEDYCELIDAGCLKAIPGQSGGKFMKEVHIQTGM